MSLRDFKQTLLLVESSQAATWARGDRKAPPKGRLRDQLACIERQAADLECTVVGDSLPPSLPSPSPPPSLFSSSLSPISPQRPKLCHPSTTQIRPPKRIKLSDYAPALVIELCLRGGNSCAQEIEAHGIGGAEQSCCVNGLELEREQRQHDDEEEEEGGGGSVVRADSEAGPFIQSQTEGLQEPLVLWPPLGGGNDEVGGIVEVPASINGRLMPHQREGVKFLYSLYRANKGGVLGDDMGLGKTIQVIAFLAAVLQSDHSRVKTRAEGDKYELLKQRKQVLVVAPTSVLGNWEQEFHAWGAFEVAIYHGAHRESVLRKLESRTLQIVLTSFDTFRIHGESLCTIDWDCMVVDEAHRLKNDKSDLYKAFTKVQTRRRYGLTGTIMQNKIMDLFNVFDWAAPGCLGSREHFREYYDEPLKQGQRISAPERFIKLAEDRRLHLTKVLQNVLLRREKHDTIGHLMKGKEDNVIFCEMSPLQRRVYKRLLASPDFECLAKKGELCTCGGPLTRAECCFRTVSQGIIWQFLHRESVDGCDSCPYCLILPCLTKLQQVSNHLELIKPNIKDDPEKQKKDELLAEYVLAEDAGLIGGTAQEESFLGLSDTQHCGKMRALELLLAHWVQQGDKVLLFSYSVRMLDILDKFLIRKGYCFSRLDGSTAMNLRQSLVDDFNRSPSKQVFLISTRAGGLGLNLVSANRVVIFDPNWNPAQDLQAQDRSFRFGQRRHVTVYRLLAAGSLEELVYTRQIYKQQLFNIAVSGNLEKRYFEGVQDSKDHRGELFGISNLFRDLSERVFTSEIIEEHDKRVHHFHVQSCATGTKVMNEVRAGGGEGVKPKKCSESQWSIGGNAVPKKSSVKKCSKETLAVVLKDAGVVYAHRNEDVVNCKAVASKYNDDAGKEKTTAKRGTLCPPATHRPAVDATKAKCISKPAKQSLKKMSKDRFLASDRMSRGKLAQSKEEQFACLAKFKGMEIAEFCKWLLSLSETEKQNLLLDFNQKKKQVV